MCNNSSGILLRVAGGDGDDALHLVFTQERPDGPDEGFGRYRSLWSRLGHRFTARPPGYIEGASPHYIPFATFLRP